MANLDEPLLCGFCQCPDGEGVIVETEFLIVKPYSSVKGNIEGVGMRMRRNHLR